MKVIVSRDGRIALPAEIRTQDEIQPGQQFEFKRIAKGNYCIHRQRQKKGFVEWLLDCPEKGYFVPIEFNE